jgi:DNA end-binding protein Ku
MITPATGNRIKMLTVDAGTEEKLERKNLVKGYEIAKGEYVIVTQEEIDSVKLESTKTIEIERFVPAADIDHLYWDNPYYLVPDGKMAAEPFTVIREAMERAEQVALGRIVISSRERLVAIEPRDRGLVATTLRSYDEVRAMKDYFADIPQIRPDPEMIAIAAKIIAQKEADFDPTEFKDHYEDALRELIERKQKGHKISKKDEPAESNVINLMDALKASLKGGGEAKPKKADKPSKPAPKKRAKQ